MSKKVNKTISADKGLYNEFKMFCVKEGKTVSGSFENYMKAVVNKKRKEMTKELLHGEQFGETDNGI